MSKYLTTKHICLNCGIVFINKANAKFHSDECRSEYWRNHNRDRIKYHNDRRNKNDITKS